MVKRIFFTGLLVVLLLIVVTLCLPVSVLAKIIATVLIIAIGTLVTLALTCDAAFRANPETEESG